MLHAAITLIGYVRGMAMNFEVEAQAEQDTGMSDDQWMAAQEPTFAAFFASERYRTLSRVTAEPDIALDLHTLFEFGLQRLLDGYAARIQASLAARSAR
jgi:Tetracyclin repressor-like, C-terminal domain